MAKRKARQNGLSFHRAHKSKQDDISAHTLIVMVILVLVASVLSATLYVYAFYGNSNYTQIQKSSLFTVVEERPAASGMVTIQIIEPPKGSK